MEKLGTTLQRIEVSGNFGDPFLVQPEATVDLTLRLNDDDAECLAAMTADGEVYELYLPPGWAATTTPSLLGPDGEEVGPSDTFEVSGELARGDGFCGPGLILFADSIETSAMP